MRFEILIDGMLAVHARHAVFTALGGVEGVARASVELGRAEVEFSPAAGGDSEAALRVAVESAGYRVLSIRGLPRTLPTIET